MQTSQSFKFKNKHLVFQAFEQLTPNSYNYQVNCSLPRFFSKFQTETPEQTLHSQKLKSKYWNKIQQQLFNQFWLQTFIENPCQNFSLDAPLNRKSYNKAVSNYIKKRAKGLNLQCQKSPTQCKSKFGTIRRKIQRQRQKNASRFSMGFIDFIIQKAQTMLPQWAGIQDKIQRVKELRKNQGPFLKIILEEHQFQKSLSYLQTFTSLLNYVAKNQQTVIPQSSQ